MGSEAHPLVAAWPSAGAIDRNPFPVEPSQGQDDPFMGLRLGLSRPWFAP
ncbi:MAG: hypothetical protein ACI8QS_003238 [Planctomycetota bacterium]|jgi:hypothetical protein